MIVIYLLKVDKCKTDQLVKEELCIGNLSDQWTASEPKNILYKHMTAIGKNVYYDVLDDVVNKYNNTKHSTIKMKPIDVRDNNNKRGNLSDQWTASESKKAGLYGNIYDFVVDYEQILGVNPIYDMHRYLMTKHNISL